MADPDVSSDAPPIAGLPLSAHWDDGTIYRGRVRSYNPKRGYGFIVCPEVRTITGQDVFLPKKRMLELLERVLGPRAAFDESLLELDIEFFVENSVRGLPQARWPWASESAGEDTSEVPPSVSIPGGSCEGLPLLSLFDGIRGASVALRNLGVTPALDLSSEVDRTCELLCEQHYPDAQQLGSVCKLSEETIGKLLDEHGRRLWLVIGGSPCQDLSQRRGGQRKGLDGKKSKLFFEYVRVLSVILKRKDVRCAFVLENVASMHAEDRDAISAALGVTPVDIDALLVSGCRRRRLYWTNLLVAPVVRQPVDMVALLEPGCRKLDPSSPFPCFVSSVTRGPPPTSALVVDASGQERETCATERERLMGFPAGFTELAAPAGDGGVSGGASDLGAQSKCRGWWCLWWG